MASTLMRMVRGGRRAEKVALPRVVQAGHPVLRHEAAVIPLGEIEGKETQDLIDQMIEVMRKNDGCGLAAPQIGISKQLLVAEFTPEMIKDCSQGVDPAKFDFSILPLTVLLNPKIKFTSNKVIEHREGCLSVNGYTAHVPRVDEVEVTGFDRKKSFVKIHLKGWASRILQHECDHLCGRLYIDHMDTSTFSCNEEICKHPPSLKDRLNDGVR